MKTVLENQAKSRPPRGGSGRTKCIMNMVLAAMIAGTIMVTDSGCKSSKAAAAAKAKAAADAQAKADAAAKAKADAAAAAAAAKAAADAASAKKREPYDRVENYFQQISRAGSVVNANQIIASALNSFSSGDVPVLIIIYRSGTTVDYDQPTTISKYLNYIKDQKASPNSVDHLEMDSNGKITQVVLIKK